MLERSHYHEHLKQDRRDAVRVDRLRVRHPTIGGSEDRVYKVTNQQGQEHDHTSASKQLSRLRSLHDLGSNTSLQIF
jgi:hypothetical protein